MIFLGKKASWKRILCSLGEETFLGEIFTEEKVSRPRRVESLQATNSFLASPYVSLLVVVLGETG